MLGEIGHALGMSFTMAWEMLRMMSRSSHKDMQHSMGGHTELNHNNG